MDDPAGFLDAIRADRTDEVARLVYADWLDDRGLNGAAARAKPKLHSEQTALLMKPSVAYAMKCGGARLIIQVEGDPSYATPYKVSMNDGDNWSVMFHNPLRGVMKFKILNHLKGILDGHFIFSEAGQNPYASSSFQLTPDTAWQQYVARLEALAKEKP